MFSFLFLLSLLKIHENIFMHFKLNILHHHDINLSRGFMRIKYIIIKKSKIFFNNRATYPGINNQTGSALNFHKIMPSSLILRRHRKLS
jgi:hypothetical protein